MPHFLKYALENGEHVLRIEGVITPNEWGWWYREVLGVEPVNPATIQAQLATLNGEDLTLIIDSPGGDCDAGAAIYTALMEYPGHITVKITSRAYSYASLLAMTGDRRLISPAAKFMLHNPFGGFEGDYRDASTAYQCLRAERDTMARLYAEATGKPFEVICALLDAETWLDAEQAVQEGFVHAVMAFDNETPAPTTKAANLRGLRQVFALERDACQRRVAAVLAEPEPPAPITPAPAPDTSAQRTAIATRCRLMLADFPTD